MWVYWVLEMWWKWGTECFILINFDLNSHMRLVAIILDSTDPESRRKVFHYDSKPNHTVTKVDLPLLEAVRPILWYNPQSTSIYLIFHYGPVFCMSSRQGKYQFAPITGAAALQGNWVTPKPAIPARPCGHISLNWTVVESSVSR